MAEISHQQMASIGFRKGDFFSEIPFLEGCLKIGWGIMPRGSFEYVSHGKQTEAHDGRAANGEGEV